MDEDSLPQQRLRERFRALLRTDPRVVAALEYGSWPGGEGDRWSDVEFWLWLRDESLAGFDVGAWAGGAGETLGVLAGAFGATLVVMAGDARTGPVRVELHAAARSELERVRAWPLGDEPFDPAAMLVVDRDGELGEVLARLAARPSRRRDPARVQALVDGLLDAWLLGLNALARGEAARAEDALAHVRRHLLWLARLVEGADGRHWLTPSRGLEPDLSPAAYARYARATARLDPGELRRAYREAWAWGGELAAALARSAGVDERAGLRRALAGRVAAELGAGEGTGAADGAS